MMIDNGQPVEAAVSMIGGIVLSGLLLSTFTLGYWAGARNNQSDSALSKAKMHCIATNESTMIGNTLARDGEWREFDLECVEIDKP